MKTTVAAALAALAALAVLAAAGPAPAARAPSSSAAQTATLAKRVAALERKTAALTKQVTTLRATIGASLAFTECAIGATADAFAGTWSVIDQIAQATQGKTYFGAQPVVSDFQACSALNINRAAGIPPNLSVFSALTALLR